MTATSQLLASMCYANIDEAMCRCVLKFYKHCFVADDCFTWRKILVQIYFAV